MYFPFLNEELFGTPESSTITGCSRFRNYMELLGGGFKDFLCSPRKLGKISNLTNIFQRG